jgi:hypothetical protein
MKYAQILHEQPRFNKIYRNHCFIDIQVNDILLDTWIDYIEKKRDLPLVSTWNGWKFLEISSADHVLAISPPQQTITQDPKKIQDTLDAHFPDTYAYLGRVSHNGKNYLFLSLLRDIGVETLQDTIQSSLKWIMGNIHDRTFGSADSK